MAKRGKITVRHFVNDRLKPNYNNRYPLYIQVIVAGKKTQVRSLSFINKLLSDEFVDIKEDSSTYYTGEELDKVLIDEGSKENRILKEEVAGITNFLKYVDPFSIESFSLSNFSVVYNGLVNILSSSMEFELLHQIKEEKYSGAKLKPVFALIDRQYRIKELYDFTKLLVHEQNCKSNLLSELFDNLHVITELKRLISIYPMPGNFLFYDIFSFGNDLIDFVRSTNEDLSRSKIYSVTLSKYIESVKKQLRSLFIQSANSTFR